MCNWENMIKKLTSLLCQEMTYLSLLLLLQDELKTFPMVSRVLLNIIEFEILASYKTR